MPVLAIAGGVLLGLLAYTFLPELINAAFWIACVLIVAFIAIVMFNG